MTEVTTTSGGAGGPVLTWLGTAGFRIEYRGAVILIDPYLSRNPGARPVQEKEPTDFADADVIFVSHGHFDHLADVPLIARISGATVYCSDVAAATLRRLGVPPERLSTVAGGWTVRENGFTVRVTGSRHIRFDAALVASTFTRAWRDLPYIARAGRKMPAGTVLVLTFDFGGTTFTHMGSLGLAPEDAGLLPKTDVLLPTLQGHTDICSRAARLTEAVAPRAVVPQHFDDFFPPVSQYVDPEPFRLMVAQRLPGCRYYEPEINRPFTLDEVLEG